MTHLNAEILADLRNKVWSIQKLDFAYITAIGTIIAILKFNRYELFDLIADARIFILLFFIILIIDAYIADVVFREWISVKVNGLNQVSSSFIIGLVSVQPFIHILFLTVTGAYVVGLFSGASDFKKDLLNRVHGQEENRAHIQEEIELFTIKKSNSPKSLENLETESPNTRTYINNLANEEIKYKKTGKKTYQLTFGGNDKKIGTKDDVYINQHTKLNDTTKNIKNAIISQMCIGDLSK